MEEIDENRQSNRYYHGEQLTETQRKVLRQRGQPEVIFNRSARKVNGIVGVVMKLRNDPKAFPRTAKSQNGADLATAVLRYVLDTSQWKDIEADSVPIAARARSASASFPLEEGDNEDPDIGVKYVDPVTYFYDPRSIRPDFRIFAMMAFPLGERGRARRNVPRAREKIAQDSSATRRRRMTMTVSISGSTSARRSGSVEHWYKHEGQWKWCIYANWTILARGDSPFYLKVRKRLADAFALCEVCLLVDPDGQRYGLMRNLKGPQDAINQHRSKAMHIMNTRQIFARRGVFGDVEKARKEAARPDGFLEYDGNLTNFGLSSRTKSSFQQTQYFQDAKEEIENYGPSPAIVGTNVNQRSGRALAMMQQNGIAELGPFLKNYRTWKMELYRSIWCTVQRTWNAERYIRISDDQEMAQFIQVNGMQLGPDGMPQLINHIASLDVDIVLDEGRIPRTSWATPSTFCRRWRSRTSRSRRKSSLSCRPSRRRSGQGERSPEPAAKPAAATATAIADAGDGGEGRRRSGRRDEEAGRDAEDRAGSASRADAGDPRNDAGSEREPVARASGDATTCVGGRPWRQDRDAAHSREMDMFDAGMRVQQAEHDQAMQAQFRDGADARAIAGARQWLTHCRAASGRNWRPRADLAGHAGRLLMGSDRASPNARLLSRG